MKITLTSEQKKALELRHNKVRDVHECDRINDVDTLFRTQKLRVTP